MVRFISEPRLRPAKSGDIKKSVRFDADSLPVLLRFGSLTVHMAAVDVCRRFRDLPGEEYRSRAMVVALVTVDNVVSGRP